MNVYKKFWMIHKIIFDSLASLVVVGSVFIHSSSISERQWTFFSR